MSERKPTIIEKNGKPEYAVLPWDEYEALVAASEDARDIAALEAFDSSDDDERLPAEMVRRLIDGENPVRVWREHRGMTSSELAHKSGLGPSCISQIETGRRAGTLKTLRAIAHALDVTVSDLIPAED